VRDLNRLLDEGADETIMDLWSRTRQWSIDEFTKIYEELMPILITGSGNERWMNEQKPFRRSSSTKASREPLTAQLSWTLKTAAKGVWVLLREDGTPLYSAKDIALAEQKFNKYDITRSIYVVGKAQALHMEQLFLTLNEMGFEHADKCFHLSFE
jgi:arginyl-tRNA synthetase